MNKLKRIYFSILLRKATKELKQFCDRVNTLSSKDFAKREYEIDITFNNLVSRKDFLQSQLG